MLESLKRPYERVYAVVKLWPKDCVELPAMRKENMELSASRVEDLPLINLRGEIDHSNAAKVSAAIDQLLREEHRVVLLDLSDVAYMDSGGISVVLSALRRLRGRGWLGIINPNANVRRLFQIVGLSLDEGLRLFSDRSSAEEAWRSQEMQSQPQNGTGA